MVSKREKPCKITINKNIQKLFDNFDARINKIIDEEIINYEIPLIQCYDLRTSKSIIEYAKCYTNSINLVTETNGNYLYIAITSISCNGYAYIIIKIGFTDNIVKRLKTLDENETYNGIKIKHKLLLLKKVNCRTDETELHKRLHENYPTYCLNIKKTEKSSFTEYYIMNKDMIEDINNLNFESLEIEKEKTERLKIKEEEETKRLKIKEGEKTKQEEEKTKQEQTKEEEKTKQEQTKEEEKTKQIESDNKTKQLQLELKLYKLQQK